MDNCGNITKPKTRVYNYLATLDLFKQLPDTISDDTVFFPRNFLLNTKKRHLYTDEEGKLVFEPGKKTPMTWETFVNKELIASVSKIYGMVLPSDTKIVEFILPGEGKTKYIDPYIQFNQEILDRIEKYAYEYPQELVPPQMEESNKLEPDDFTTKESPSPSITPSITTPIVEKGQYKLFSKVDQTQVELLTKEAAEDLFTFLSAKTGLTGKVINDKSQKFKGAVIEGVPIINVAYAELSDGFHEYLHPVMMSLRISNPQLFNKLYNDLKKLPQWKEIADRTLKRVQKFYPELTNINDFIEEALVTALGYASEIQSKKQLETVRANNPLFQWANNFYKWLTEFLNGFFTNTVDLSKVGLETTLENVVEWVTDTRTKILLTENWQDLSFREQEIDDSLKVTEADNLTSLENSLLSGLERKDKAQTLEEYISSWVKSKFKPKVRDYKPKKYDQQSFVYQEAQRLISAVANSGYTLNIEEIKSLPEKTYQELANVIDKLDLNFRFTSWLVSKGTTPIAINSPFKPDNTPATELEAVEIFRKELQSKYPERRSFPANELANEYNFWAKENYGLSVTDAVGHVGYGLDRLLTPNTNYKNYTRKLFLDNYIVKQGHNFNIGKNVTGNGLGWYASVEIENDGFDHEFQSDILPEISKSYKKDEYKSSAYQLSSTSSEELAQRIAFQKVAKQIEFSLDSKLLNILDPKTFEFTRSLDVVKDFLISEQDVQVDQAKAYGVIPDYLVNFKIISKVISTLKAPKSENYKQLEDWIKKYIVVEQTSQTKQITETTYNEEYLPFSKEPKRFYISEYTTTTDGNKKNFKYYALSEGFDKLPDFIQIEIDRHNAWHNSGDLLKPMLPTYSRAFLAAFAQGRSQIPIQKIYPPGATKLRNYWETGKSLNKAKIFADALITKTFNRYRKAKKIIKGSNFRKKLYENTDNIVEIKNYWKDQYERYLQFYKTEYEFVKQEAENQVSEKNLENRENFYKKYADIYKKWFDITIQHSINTRKLQGKTYYYLPTAQAMEAIEGNTIAAPLYRTTFEVNNQTNTIKNYLIQYIQQNNQDTTNEIKKYWPQISNFINQESTVADIADALIKNTNFIEESKVFKDFVVERDARYKINKPTVGPFYSALSKFAKKNNIKLTYETPYWSKSPLVKVDISEYEYKPIDRFSKVEIPSSIKPGVPELFESNESFANAVYEAAGFKEYSKETKDKLALTESLKNIFKDKSTVLFRAGENTDAFYIDLVKTSDDRYFYFSEGQSPEEISKKRFAEEVEFIDGQIATTEEKDKFINSYLEIADLNQISENPLLSKEQKLEAQKDILKKITPQQKQQAQQLYSQYLEQNPNGDIEGFKEFVREEPQKEASPFYEMSSEEREQRFQDFYNQNQNISEEEAREYFNRCMI